jgi:nucleotide-binding universal stress UspA family protein
MNVLFATDGTTASVDAIEGALRLLPLKAAKVHVVAVANPLGVLPAFDGMASSAMLIVDQLEQAARADLVAARGVLLAAGIDATTEELEGDPATSILDAARRFGADLIVLGSHGKGALARFFVGSVSDRVSHQWPGAVLIIHPTPKED